MRVWHLAAAVLSLLASGPALAQGAPAQGTPAQGAKPPLVFTGIPDQDESRLVERFGRVATYLEGKLGVPVRYIPVKNYPAAVTAFTAGVMMRGPRVRSPYSAVSEIE